MSNEDKGRSDAEELAHQVVASGVGSVIGTLGGPVTTILGSAAGPFAAYFMDVITDYFERSLSKKERERIGTVAKIAAQEVARHWDAGHELRPELRTPGAAFNSASELIDGTFGKAQREYESKKYPHLAYYIPNMMFHDSILLEDGFYHLILAEQLTYRQFALLALFLRQDAATAFLDRPHVRFDEQPQPHLGTLLELNDLFQIGLLAEKPEKGRQGREDRHQVHELLGGLQEKYGGTHTLWVRPQDIFVSTAGHAITKSFGLSSIDEPTIRTIGGLLGGSVPA